MSEPNLHIVDIKVSHKRIIDSLNKLLIDQRDNTLDELLEELLESVKVEIRKNSRNIRNGLKRSRKEQRSK